MRGAEAFKPFYEAARAQWPILPANPEVISQSDPNGAEFAGLTSDGRPIFWIDPEYLITDVIAYHEIGHAVEALLDRRGISKDRTRTGLWTLRGFPGTWQQQDSYARTLTGMQQWINLPVEIVAENWRCGHMGYPTHERTMDWGIPIDNAAVRTYFENLQAEAIGVAQVDYPGAIWKGSPNYWVGRDFGPPQYIVEHWTVASAASTIATFQSATSRVSAHYMVARDGTVYQFVREANTAWHDGYDPDGYGPLPGWNHISIGIEHEHEPGQDWPEVQMRSSDALHRSIEARTGIPLVRDHCLGHNETGYATSCPGDLPIDHIIGGDGMTADPQVIALLTQIEANTRATYDKVNALGIGIPIWEDRASGGRDVMTGGPKPGIEP